MAVQRKVRTVYRRLLSILTCPECAQTFDVEELGHPSSDGGEVTTGLLFCPGGHCFPVVGGIPRMLPDSLSEHWHRVEGLVRASSSPRVRSLADARSRAGTQRGYDERTRANFSLEWAHHRLGDKTWGMELDDRVQWFFVDPLRIPVEELKGKIVLDAGCGNGSQSVAYTKFGAEVIALDISSGLELGHAFRHEYPGACPDMVHFVQADLRRPPLAPASVDIVHSAGVLQATPNTERSFRVLAPLVRPGGLFYTWVLKHEPMVTPIVNGIRAATTRVPAPAFAKIADGMAPAFIGFCRLVDRLGLRRYPEMTRREAAIALLDIFGAPYAHYHSYEELSHWYSNVGFDEMWRCNDDRRGFGICGRKAAGAEPEPPAASTTTSPAGL